MTPYSVGLVSAVLRSICGWCGEFNIAVRMGAANSWNKIIHSFHDGSKMIEKSSLAQLIRNLKNFEGSRPDGLMSVSGHTGQ